MRAILAVLLAAAAGAAHAQPALPVVKLTAGMHVIQAELAQEPEARMRGLMHRKSLAPNGGMLFVFDEQTIHCMWMKDTFVPLSVAFLDASGTIVSISDMEPQSEQTHCAARPALYALEMNRGWFAQRGIKPGMRIAGAEKYAPPRR